MEIGNKILNLRKQKNLSQEQLAEQMGVARQTISKWELGETSPDLNQAKQLSQIFKVSLDELTNNDIKDVLTAKMSNTEKLAGIIIKILKVIGLLFIVYIAFMIFMFVLFVVTKRSQVNTLTESVELSCSLDGNDYIIDVGTDGYFNCSNCSKELQKELKNKYIDFGNIPKTEKNINSYFHNQNGFCE